MLKKSLLIGYFFILLSGVSETSHVDHFVRGKAYFYRGRIVDAKQEFRKAQRLNPGYDKIDEQLAAEVAEYLKKIEEKKRYAAGLQKRVAQDYEAEGNFISAAKAYQKLIEQYPDTKEATQALDELYRIATYILEEGGRPRLFTESNFYIARGFFQFLLKRLPFGERAASVKHKIGLSYFYDGNFSEAISYYNKVIKNYPQTRYAEKALFGIATSYLNQSITPPRDQTMTEYALKEFKNFQQLFPDSPLQKEVKEKIAILKEQLAKHFYKIGTFYKKQGDFTAAKIYYKSILRDFPKTTWAAISTERLNELISEITTH